LQRTKTGRFEACIIGRTPDGQRPATAIKCGSAEPGISLIAYLRGRRLSEAAKALAAGAPDIFSVALDAGYGSHEAGGTAEDDPISAVQ
jgi:methylphosphotriester-DNA--protein-cysteine methyltransferase